VYKKIANSVVYFGLLALTSGTNAQHAAKVPRTGSNFLLAEGLFTRPPNPQDEAMLKQHMASVKSGAKLGAVTGKLVGARCEASECFLKIDNPTWWETTGGEVATQNSKSVFEFRGMAASPAYGIMPGKDMGWGSFIGTGKGVGILGKNWDKKIKTANQSLTVLYLIADKSGQWQEMGSYSRVIVHDQAAAMKPAEVVERLKAVYGFMKQ